MPDSVGNARKAHPLPLRLRNPFVEKVDGGSKGFRGSGFTNARLRALYRGRGRSSITGLPASKVKLEVDHIDPYRCGGLTPHSNEQTNLRISDFDQNKYIDYAEGAQEKPAVRRMRSF